MNWTGDTENEDMTLVKIRVKDLRNIFWDINIYIQKDNEGETGGVRLSEYPLFYKVNENTSKCC